jgi:hypothetical protein
VDVRGGEHGFGTSAQVVFLETFLNAALATGQFLAYFGVHSKSFHAWVDEHWANTYQTPEMAKDFEFFHELRTASSGSFA